MSSTRRDFLKKTSVFGAGLAITPNIMSANIMGPSPSFQAKYMGDFAAPKLDTVRCAFIGVGSRGSGHVSRIASIEGTEVVAISDLYEDLANKSVAKCIEKGNGERHKNIAVYTGGENDWKKMLKEVKPDAVFICTPWKLHAPMAIEAMLQGWFLSTGCCQIHENIEADSWSNYKQCNG